MFQPEEARSFEDIINDSYDDIESHFNRMIDEGHDAMFDAQLFQQEIHRLVDIYSLPKEVNDTIILLPCSSKTFA